MKKTVFAFCFVCFTFCFAANAQQTAQAFKSDTVEIASYAARYDPKKAALYAAVLPGLGQIYNKKYWKLPLVYGGFIGFGYGISFYQKGYTKYKSELFDILETDAPLSTSGYTEDQLRSIVDKYRRERDFFMILMAGMYLLQIIDAHVDAHLKEFDLNPNLHVRVQPTMETDRLMGRSTGFSIKLRF
jgi:hypothetical protein